MLFILCVNSISKHFHMWTSSQSQHVTCGIWFKQLEPSFVTTGSLYMLNTMEKRLIFPVNIISSWTELNILWDMWNQSDSSKMPRLSIYSKRNIICHAYADWLKNQFIIPAAIQKFVMFVIRRQLILHGIKRLHRGYNLADAEKLKN